MEISFFVADFVSTQTESRGYGAEKVKVSRDLGADVDRPNRLENGDSDEACKANNIADLIACSELSLGHTSEYLYRQRKREVQLDEIAWQH